jgi:hypothetical protein
MGVDFCICYFSYDLKNIGVLYDFSTFYYLLLDCDFFYSSKFESISSITNNG